MSRRSITFNLFWFCVGLSTVRRKFRVTKAPDDTSDDYEVEQVQS